MGLTVKRSTARALQAILRRVDNTPAQYLPRFAGGGAAAGPCAWKLELNGDTLTIKDAVVSYGGRTYVHPSAQVTVHPADLVWCDWSIVEHRFSFVAGDPEEGTVYTEDGNQVYECEVPLQSGLNHRIWLCEMDPNGQIGRDFIHGAFCPFLYDTRTAAEVSELPVED